MLCMTEQGFATAWAACRNIDGWLSPGQAEALYSAAREVKGDDWIVEIGSHHGRSTVVLALAKAPEAKLMAIDPWDAPRWGGGEGAEQAFQRNLREHGVDDAVTVFKGYSTEAEQTWNGAGIGLLFIDGAHDYPSVVADIDGWERHIRPGGVVAIHDSFSSVGVTKALLARHLLNRRFRFVGNRRTLALYRREDLSPAGLVSSTLFQLTRLLYFGRNLLVKLAITRGWARVVRVLRHGDGRVFPY
jgi:predicted O-methyltransferase YrrM